MCAASTKRPSWPMAPTPSASDRRYVSIAAGVLDLPTGLVTARHIFVETKGDYYRIDNGVAQSPGTMAANPVTF